MKPHYLALTTAITLFCGSAFAGPPDYKQTAPPPPPPVCGTGWYFGIGGGANLYQDFGGSESFIVGEDIVTVGTNDHIGGFGGIKIGYVFGQGTWRFGIEEDMFYNGVNAGAFVNVNDVRFADIDASLNTAAFMTNFSLRYAPNGGCGFQPYIFGGIGGWFGETGGDVTVTIGETVRNFEGRSGGGFAFQFGAGVDYYFSPKWAIYVEYKYLNYMNVGGDYQDSTNVGQQLVGGGLKFHF